MRITVPAGGVGAARFLRGLKTEAPGDEITVIGNTGDDITLFGLHVSPDLDTVMYTLGGGINEDQGWGRAGDTYHVLDELKAYGAGPAWFGLGDTDIATHLYRTSLLAAGLPLSAATAVLCQRWQPGVRLLPMSDDRVETHVVLAGGEGGRTVHFQEWWVRMGAQAPATGFVFAGAAEAATPRAARHLSAIPRTGAPPMIGDTPTTVLARIASAIPGTARIVPMLTTGLDGGIRITSAPAIASSTPGAGDACAAPAKTKPVAGT